ncbi:MAG: flippase-like domain-containing protein [Schwartzia sp.]|nr:flippase-like domain-containing protein [Schwartzia sp. (in: firmicutes)]
MNKFYKRLAFLVVLVIAISSAVIYFTVDINTLSNLTIFKPQSVLMAIFFIGLGLFLDGTRLMRLVRISNENIKLSDAVQVVFGNYFLALLTPGMTGGAVAQLMFLRHAGVPTGKATVVVLVRTIVSIFFLILCLPFIFMHDQYIFPGLSNAHLMVISLTVFLMILLMIIGIRKNMLNHLAVYIARKLPPKYRSRFIKMYRDIQSATRLLAASPWQMTLAFVESGLSLIAIYAVVPCLIIGLGVNDADWYAVMGRMIFLNMLLYFMPTPGGSGIAEGGFVWLFSDIVPAGTVGIVAVSWRLIAEYLPFLIGFYYTLKVFGANFLAKKEIEAAEKMP